MGGVGVGEAASHQPDHCPFDHRLGVLDGALVVPVDTSTLIQPREGALDHPAASQHLEPALAFWLVDDIYGHA